MAMPVLILLSLSHFINDMLQSVIAASYPLLKTELDLTFTQIGAISLVYQLASSVFQPVVGAVYDRRPNPRSIPIGMCFTLTGLLLLAFARPVWLISAAVFLVGIGSATLHPEASRITSLAAGGRRGFAQSLFQVGGNLGGSLGPLLVAAVVSAFGRRYIALFSIISLAGILCTRPVCTWYGRYLEEVRETPRARTAAARPPFGPAATAAIIGVLSVLIFSKYIYMASLSNYYTFYLMEKFGVRVTTAQVCLFVFLFATTAGTLAGGPVGDRIGRKWVIWASILGTAPFSLLLPGAGFAGTVVLSFCAGFMIASAFPAILLYAQELLPSRLGTVSGLFFGFAFGVAGVAAAILGRYADRYGVIAIYRFCCYTPLLGLVAVFLPDLKKRARKSGSPDKKPTTPVK
ncbi:MAG: MFS transporter [Bacteroidales bacterium]|nr:MFS transporter [Bacteroidales bacterium]